MSPPATMTEIAKTLFNNPLFTVTMFTATGDGTGRPRIKAAMGPSGTAMLTIYYDLDLGSDQPFMFVVKLDDLEVRQPTSDSDARSPLGAIQNVLDQLRVKAFDTSTHAGAMIMSIDISIDAIRMTESAR